MPLKTPNGYLDKDVTKGMFYYLLEKNSHTLLYRVTSEDQFKDFLNSKECIEILNAPEKNVQAKTSFNPDTKTFSISRTSDFSFNLLDEETPLEIKFPLKGENIFSRATIVSKERNEVIVKPAEIRIGQRVPYLLPITPFIVPNDLIDHVRTKKYRIIRRLYKKQASLCPKEETCHEFFLEKETEIEPLVKLIGSTEKFNATIENIAPGGVKIMIKNELVSKVYLSRLLYIPITYRVVQASRQLHLFCVIRRVSQLNETNSFLHCSFLDKMPKNIFQ